MLTLPIVPSYVAFNIVFPIDNAVTVSPDKLATASFAISLFTLLVFWLSDFKLNELLKDKLISLLSPTCNVILLGLHSICSSPTISKFALVALSFKPNCPASFSPTVYTYPSQSATAVCPPSEPATNSVLFNPVISTGLFVWTVFAVL